MFDFRFFLHLEDAAFTDVSAVHGRRQNARVPNAAVSVCNTAVISLHSFLIRFAVFSIILSQALLEQLVEYLHKSCTYY